jgi:hypothetical protein
LDGVECLRDLDGGGEDIEFRQKKGVRPVVDELPGSENLTRFFARCGVAGGVAMPCTCCDVISTLGWESRSKLEVLPRLVSLWAIGRSSSRSMNGIFDMLSSSCNVVMGLGVVDSMIIEHKPLEQILYLSFLIYRRIVAEEKKRRRA